MSQVTSSLAVLNQRIPHHLVAEWDNGYQRAWRLGGLFNMNENK